MANTLPKIAVITPVLNAASVIEHAIQSVLKQNYPNFNYMIMDAHSKDGTAEIIQKYANQLTFIQQKDNGPADAYNFAIRQSNADIIAMLSADDWLEEGVLEKVGNAFNNDSNIDIVSTRARMLKANADGEMQIVKEFSYAEIDFTLQSVLDWPLTNARFYRKHLFDAYGYFKPRDRHDQYNVPADTEVLLKFVLHPIKHVRLDCVGYNFLCHENSLTSNTNLHKKNQVSQQLIDIYEDFMRQNLTKEQCKLFQNYHARELISIILRSVQMGDISSLIHSYRKAIMSHKLNFLKHFVFNIVRLLKKRVTFV